MLTSRSLVLAMAALSASVVGAHAQSSDRKADKAPARPETAPAERPARERNPAPNRPGTPRPGPFGAPGLSRFDTDGDGKISRAEFRKAQDALFDRLDRNGDGVIDESERPGPAPWAGRGPVARPFGPGRGFAPPAGPGRGFARPGGPPREGAAGRRPGPAERPGFARGGERLLAMDANGDGKITEEEFTGPKALFGRLDRNDDGVIDRDDLPTLGRRPGDRERERARDGGGRPEARPRRDGDRPRRDGERNRDRPRGGNPPAQRANNAS